MTSTIVEYSIERLAIQITWPIERERRHGRTFTRTIGDRLWTRVAATWRINAYRQHGVDGGLFVQETV